MIDKLLTEHHLEFLSLKGGCRGSLSLHLSNCQIVGNHMSWLNLLIKRVLLNQELVPKRSHVLFCEAKK